MAEKFDRALKKALDRMTDQLGSKAGQIDKLRKQDEDGNIAITFKVTLTGFNKIVVKTEMAYSLGKVQVRAEDEISDQMEMGI